MKIKKMKVDIYFDFCRDAVVPEIPRVQDVLYALRLTDEQKSFDFCRDNHATYIVNVGLVIVAIGYKVLSMERYDEAVARKLIAEAIIALCPPEAKCLFNSAFVEAQEIFVGKPAPSKTASRRDVLDACGCAECTRMATEERRYDVFYTR